MTSRRDIPRDEIILIADDDPAVVRVLTRILRRAGFERVLSTTDSSAVVDQFEAHEPDLLLLDLSMPGPDGFEILRRLSDLVSPEVYVPILVLTGNVSAEARQKALAGGAKDFLTKPFDVPEVLVRIDNLLETRRLHLQISHQNRILEERVRERTRSLEEARLDVLARLARAAEFRDDETGEHTRRVGDLSARLASRLGLPAEEAETLRLTAPLHDVGKIGIPDSILLKPGALSPAEWEIMRTHVTIGAQLLADSPWPLLKYAREISLHHHEWWDGSGHPMGLRGSDIPVAARIVSVADVFDALSHDRTYRPAWPLEKVLDTIRAGSGTQFDPRVVAALIDEIAETSSPRVESHD